MFSKGIYAAEGEYQLEYLVGRCGVVDSKLAFGSNSRGFESELGLFFTS
jgi:hypothetical protein